MVQASLPIRPVRLGQMRAEMRRGSDGVLYIRSIEPLAEAAHSIPDEIARWAERTPNAIMIADRGPDGNWRKLTYGQVMAKLAPLAQALLDAEVSAERPLLILSGNEIEHQLLGLAAIWAGVPYAPVSAAYSLVSTDYGKLRHIVDLLEPGMVYASDGARFAPAIDAVIDPAVPVIIRHSKPASRACRLFSELESTPVTGAVASAHEAVTPDTIAKFLFTSGSTGMPKAVITTNRMMTSNQEMIRSALAFLQDEPPVLLDWMPWNHVAGGSHNTGIAFYNGGSFYIDEGQPTPAKIGATIRNLIDIQPTFYSNVPKGYEFLVEHFKTNPELRKSFFSKLKLMQYAGASLSQYVWDGLAEAASIESGERIMMITGYGSTETAPFAFTTTWPVERAGMVGLPAAGMDVKLVPNGDKMELRLRGPNVTPGYWKNPEKTSEAFDEEGYYKIGDALKFADPDDLSQGFVFDGRVSEDFKLTTGTWVNFAGVRGGIISACAPLIRDVVLTGLDRNFIGAMIFPDFDACRRLANLGPDETNAEIVAHPAVMGAFQGKLDALAQSATGSASHVARAVLLTDPPEIDKSEVTDKGSINQRAVLAARADLVERLYAEPVADGVLSFSRRSK
ncbi:feruloyl-CoA synthase [Pelagibacterium lentulum]|uniref:Feruloyl-CoA synthase n=1 Tax=Pelagibacterium lentulum TaxID=2029865 RepID=A0A916RN27_9HYPH|nr:feruloyl-CoA synthase [Pelagibacterium lentulum]GGA61345.1 feruloyl-CoA synthase [Pelagibacterium lentulum]